MTAPPRPLPLFTETTCMQLPSFHPPYSTSTFPWDSMPPFQNQNAPRAPRKSTSPPTNESNDANSLLFITGNTPADFKSKKNMTKVRKKAMGSYLEKEKKPRDPRPRLTSEDSTASRTSAGSEQQDPVDPVISNSHALNVFRGEGKRSTQRPSPPAPSNYGHRTPGLDLRVAKIQQSVDLVLPSAPIVIPMRTDVILPYDETAPRPFQSIGKPLDPFRTMFQSSHPAVSVEQLKFHCSRSFGTRAMGQHWIPTLVKSPHAFLSTLCIASAHFDAINELTVESVQTLALRQEVMHLISQNLVNPTSRVDDFNVIALTQLMASELVAGEETALNFHSTGVEAMIKQRGGLNKLGVNGRLASTISWVSLEAAILHERKPRSIYLDFCASSPRKNYSNTATIPESPIFCPRTEFETIRRSSRCTPQTLDLLKDIRMMIDLFLHETKQSRQNWQSLKNLYRKITSHPTASELQRTNVLTPSDWKYESIRVAAVIQATAIIKRIPLSEALAHAAQSQTATSIYTHSTASRSSESLVSPTNLRSDSPVTSLSTSPSYTTSPAWPQTNPFNPFSTNPSASSTTSDSPFFPPPLTRPPSGPNALLQNLKTALQNSDLSDCWSDMAGPLLWIGLVAGAASRKSDRVLKKWFAALAMRVSIMLCFEHPEAVHNTMLRMSDAMEGLGYAGSSSSSSNTKVVRSEGKPTMTTTRRESPKRRRV